MPEYYTYKSDVHLGPNQELGYTPGKGYYAKDKPASSPPPQKSNPPPPSSPPPHGIQVPTNPEGPTGPAPTSNTNPPVVPPNTPPTIGVGKPGTPNTGPPKSGTGEPPKTPKGAPPHHGILTYEQVVEIWELQGGDPALSSLAAHIAECESGYNTAATHNTAYPNKPGYKPPKKGDLKEYSLGLWQINIYAHKQWTEEAMLDAYENASAIIELTGNGIHFGTTNVTCYKRAVGQPSGPPVTPPSFPDVNPVQETKASTSFHSAMVWLASDVPLRGKTLKALGDSMPAAIRSVLWPTST